MPNFHSIKFRLIALGTGLVLIGALVRQFFALPLVQEHVQDLVASQQLAIASYAAHQIDHGIRSRLSLVERLAEDLPRHLADDPEQVQVWLRERQYINPAFEGGLLAVRPDGSGLLAEYPLVPGRAGLSFSGVDWFQAALNASGAVMGKPGVGRLAGAPLIVFAAPVRNARGVPVLVLAGVAVLNAPGFLDAIQQTRLGSSGGFLLISPEDRLFVASSDPGMILKPTPAPGVNPLHDRAMAGYRGTGITVNARGVEELSAMVTVPSTGWFVVARMPTAEAFRPIHALRDMLVKGSGVVLTTMFVVLLFALPRILRPLTDAAGAIRAMAEGKRELAPLPLRRNDEVGVLVQGFNFLVARLRAEEEARRSSEERLEYLAHHDSLTGLYNRAMLEDRLAQAVARAERNGTAIALLFCDMDGFKAINDRYGHDAGDAVLRHVATQISEGRRRTDTVARIGGDEFVILLADLDDARAAADSVARQCLQALSEPFEPFEFEGHRLVLRMSIGIALHSGTALAPSQLLSRADDAMYLAKHGGGHVHVVLAQDAAPAPSASA